MSDGRGVAIALFGAALAGAMVASAMLAVGLQHNPQGEFIDTATGRLDLPYAAAIWLSWFAPIFLLGAVPAAIIAAFKALRTKP